MFFERKQRDGFPTWMPVQRYRSRDDPPASTLDASVYYLYGLVKRVNASFRLGAAVSGLGYDNPLGFGGERGSFLVCQHAPAMLTKVSGVRPNSTGFIDFVQRIAVSYHRKNLEKNPERGNSNSGETWFGCPVRCSTVRQWVFDKSHYTIDGLRKHPACCHN